MIKDSERGIFDVIIVWKLNRFARNRYDSARYKTQLKRNGVKLVSGKLVGARLLHLLSWCRCTIPGKPLCCCTDGNFGKKREGWTVPALWTESDIN